MRGWMDSAGAHPRAAPHARKSGQIFGEGGAARAAEFGRCLGLRAPTDARVEGFGVGERCAVDVLGFGDADDVVNSTGEEGTGVEAAVFGSGGDEEGIESWTADGDGRGHLDRKLDDRVDDAFGGDAHDLSGAGDGAHKFPSASHCAPSGPPLTELGSSYSKRRLDGPTRSS